MSVTERTDLGTQFSDAALEAAVSETLPSYERADAPSDPPVEASTEAGHADAPAGTEPPTPPASPAEAPAPSPKTTHPKSWKGTEDEWQAFRAEQNRRNDTAQAQARREADRARQAEERAALLDAQLKARDAAYQEILTQAYQDPRTVQEKIAASQMQGNDLYQWNAQQRAAQEAAALAAAAQQETVQSAAQRERDYDALRTFSEHLLPLEREAVRAGIDDLDVEALLKDAMASDDLADDVALTYTVDEATRQRLVNRIYREASKAVTAQIAAAKAAKAAATPPPTETKAGRQTLLGGSAGHGTVAEFSPEAAEKAIDDFYRGQAWEKRRTA